MNIIVQYEYAKTIVSTLKLFRIYNAINIFKFRSGDVAVLRGTTRNNAGIMEILNHNVVAAWL